MHYAFFLNKPKWPLTQTNLTQALVSHDPHNGILQNAVWRSFGNWVAVNQCTFEEVTMGTGDRLTGRMQWSAMHLLRRMERCILMGMGGGRCCKGERESVCLHEIEHLLRLAHTSTPGAFMAPYIPRGAGLGSSNKTSQASELSILCNKLIIII